LLILAKNLKGWKTLIKIVSESNHPDHFYHKPRLDLERLAELLDGNIIAITGHLGSTLANKITYNDRITENWKKQRNKPYISS
jgi:DNA polymerase III alpha subunit